MKLKAIAKNCLITVGILAFAALFCFFLQQISTADTHVPLLFVLAVVVISRFTDGYIYGISASMISVIGVNYVFTYPYFAIDFTLTGYPLTFLSMLAVAVIVSTLTTQIKEQEQIKLEIEKEKTRANLLRAVSHDIRTPLTSIVGSASGVVDNYDALDDHQRIELVKDIQEEAQWLIRIVENLLSVTRINGESANISTEEEIVEEIVSSAVLKFQKRFPDMQVDVSMPDEFLMFPMDGILIEQVLLNLMENSVLHGGKAVDRIHIVTRKKGNKVIFDVEDNGQGIKESILPVMFDGGVHSEPGEEVDAKRNMGIGLSVCMSIVRAHKGDMKAENISTGGARVSFWLPAGEEENYGYQG